MKNSVFYLCLATLCFFMVCCTFSTNTMAAGKTRSITASTFPIYLITRNVTHGIEGIELQLLLPSQLGCPHDYSLTPQDVQKLTKADILVINGLGMEEFLGAPVETANPDLKIIDSSNGITDILRYTDMDEHDHHENTDRENYHEKSAHDKKEAHNQGHRHTDFNPHLFASPAMTARMAMHIAEELAKTDPTEAERYLANARDYAHKMKRLADDLASAGKRLVNNRIVTQHGVFDYLARDMGLEVVAVVQAHPGQEPSAAKLLALIKDIKKKKAGAIFTEPQYPDKICQTLAKETGIAMAVLDPVATGPENAPLDYYETIMRNNLVTLEKTLGSR